MSASIDGLSGVGKADATAPALLGWYDRMARRLPWRVPPGGGRADPYRVWLSEIMLQQTTVAAVIPYFERFTARWPEIAALAAAPVDAVMAEWAGLGYYARARNLHRCAQAVVAAGGQFPDSEPKLAALPGIGPYTAAAIAAIAFDRPATVVDGNVERVVARLFAVEQPMPAAKPELRRLAATLTPALRPGDFAQAMMDLGATVCVPERPRCVVCPLTALCDGRAGGIAADLPRRTPKPDKPERTGIAWYLVDADGRLLLRRRPPRGLLGGMLELPSSGWDGGTPRDPPMAAEWRRLPGQVSHVFTHFRLHLSIDAARLAGRPPPPPDHQWAALDALGGLALPSLMTKAVRHALRAIAAGGADRADSPT